MMYGYLLENTRVDINIDNTHLIRLLQESQVTEDCIYIDAIDSIERPELRKLIKETIKPKDTLILLSISTLSNNLRDLLHTLQYVNDNGVEIVSITEPYYSYELYFLPLKDFSVIDNQWKAIKRAKGIEKAKIEKRMGRKKDIQKITDALKLYQLGIKIEDIKRITGISSSSLYRAINKDKK